VELKPLRHPRQGELTFERERVEVDAREAARAFPAKAYPELTVARDAHIVSVIADDQRLLSGERARIETVKLPVVAGRDIDKVAGDRDSLRSPKSRDRHCSRSAFEVDRFQGTVGDARDEQPLGRGIMSHVVDSACDSGPVGWPAHAGKHEGSCEDRRYGLFLGVAGCE
jgi:hypothetical protein